MEEETKTTEDETKTFREWLEEKKAYVYQEIEGITITGLVVFSVASILTCVYLNKRDHANAKTNEYNKPKNEKEVNNEDNSIAWNEIENADVLKVKTTDGREDILFVNYEDTTIELTEKYYAMNVVDVLGEFPSFQVNIDKKVVLSDSLTIEENLGALSNFLIVNSYTQNSYTKKELESFRLGIKSAELNNKNKGRTKEQGKY